MPLSLLISGIEIGKIIAFFCESRPSQSLCNLVIFRPVLGLLVMFTVTAYIVRGLQLVLDSPKRAITERAEETGSGNDAIPLADSGSG